MEKTSRDRVRETLEFKKPDRIPRQLWVLPVAEKAYPSFLENFYREYPDDIVVSPSFYQNPLKEIGGRYKKGIYIDEWGCTFHNLEDGYRGIVQKPLLKDLKDWKRVQWPEERLTVKRESVDLFCQRADSFVLSGSVQRPFERLQFIRTPELLFMDLVEESVALKRLLYKIHEFYLEEIRLWCKTDIDGLFIMDDWGSQNSLLINPSLWKRLFKPLYRDYIQLAHLHNKYVFMHSDGYIASILPELIDLGLDAINSQLFCMDIEELGREHRGRITFYGEIDRQYILPSGDREEVKRAVERVFKSLYQDGGVIAQCEFGLNAKPENVEEVFKTWNKIL